MKKRMSIGLIMVLLVASILPIYAEDQVEVYEEEVVYGLLSEDGNQDQVIVSKHLSGHQGGTLEFESSLKDLEPLMGKLKLSQADGKISMTSPASDIYYRGETTQNLPVETKITYYLDGEMIPAKDLVGKSGHVMIVVSQINHSQVEAENGKTYMLPFETALVSHVSNDVFKTIEVSSGKVIDDGQVKIISAVLTPGLSENFQMEESDFLVDQVVIQGQVENFQFPGFYMTTICKLPDIDFTSLTGKFAGGLGQVEEFEAASESLVEGSQSLSSATGLFFGKQEEAFKGFEAYLNKDAAFISSVIDYSKGVEGFNQAFDLYSAGILDLLKGIETLTQGAEGLDMGLMGFRQQLAQVLPEGQETSPLYQGLDQLIAGSNQLKAGLVATNQAGKVLKEKTLALQGVNSQLLIASQQLGAGAGKLSQGQKQLAPVLPQLREGSMAYQAGVNEFTQGVAQYKTQGVDLLIEEVTGAAAKLESFQADYEVLKLLAEDYQSFTSKEGKGSVIFILKTKALQ